MNKYLQDLSDFIVTTKYSRYNKELKRRYTWNEMIDILCDTQLKKYSFLSKDDKKEIKKAYQLVKEKKIVPSMRSIQWAGEAIEKKNLKSYNCSVRHIDSLRSFAEIAFALLCGTGVGVGIGKYFLNQIPDLISKEDMTGTVLNYQIEDSIEGWADSAEALLSCYFKNTPFTGRKIVMDYSKIRPEGSEISTGGGKAPGYKALKLSHDKIISLLDNLVEDKKQNRLKSINAYDIVMHCADFVLSGGVRRSAVLVAFDYDDKDMYAAKTFFPVSSYKRFVLDEEDNHYHGIVYVNGNKYNVAISEFEYNELRKDKKISWFHIEPQRARSNNSVLLDRKTTTKEQFKKIIKKTKQFGEPGFIFCNDSVRQLVNPCAEISFIPVLENGQCGFQMCNLCSINGAATSTKKEFLQNCKYASIIGTLQAGWIDFPYLNNASKKLTEEEALLGVSITGFMDNPDILLNEDYLQEGAHKVLITNKKWAKKIGINPAARTTCVKPEGTSSLVLGSASGIHPHHSRKYFRRVQMNHIDPVLKHFKKYNPHAVEKSVWSSTGKDEVITFPVEVDDKAMVKSDITAIKHLKLIKKVQENWVSAGTSNTNKKPIEHSVSCTVLVEEQEWEKVTEYLYNNREYFSAVSLLPKTGDKIYKQAPLEAIITKEDEEKWKNLLDNWKKVCYTEFKEDEDNTKIQQTVACAGGKCDL